MTDDFYRAFEDRYRGSRELVKSRLNVYLPFIAPLAAADDDAQAIDLGCGRGEWLEILRSAGFKGHGVDLDEGMLAACRERGLNVSRKDAISALQSLAEESQLVVSGFHIAEHLEFSVLQTLIKEALRVLKPAGLLILETPNPENIVVGSCNFYLDPTHEKPIPSQLLAFLPEYHGFARSKILRLQESAQVSQGTSLSLMDVLGGVSPDYAVVAQKSAPPPILAASQSAFDAVYGVSLEQLAQRLDHQRASKAQAVEQSFVSALNTSRQVVEQHVHASEAAVELTRSQLASLQDQLTLMGSSLQAAAAALRAAEGRLGALEMKAERTLSRRLLRAGKHRIVKPALMAANRALQRHEPLKRTLEDWMQQHAPGVHDRLQAFIRRQRPPVQLDAEWAGMSGVVNAPSDLHPLLADPDLLTLDRPSNLLSVLSDAAAVAASENLEPVVEIHQMRHSAASVCLVVCIVSDDPRALEQTVQSVLRQTDPSWELMLCASEPLEALATSWLDIDWRIRFLARGPDDSEASTLCRSALQATTRFMGLVSQGDIVDDDLVKMLGEKVRTHPGLEVVYTDEASRLSDGRPELPFYKPDWSPEHQQSVNMVGRFVAMRKSLLLAAAMPGEASGEAAEYALVLDVAAQSSHIGHVDEVLYTRVNAQRAIGGFFSAEAQEEARAALEKHVRRQAAPARVTIERRSGSLKVAWPVPDVPVTLLILTGTREREIPGRGTVVLATHFVKSIISRPSRIKYQIIVVDDGVLPDELRELLQQHGHKAVTYVGEGPFSFARKANFASRLVSSGIAILLNDDLEVVSPEWIEVLAGQAARPDIGVAGARLLFADTTLQHAGIAMGFHGSAGHVFHRAASDGEEYAGFASITRNYSAVTGAVMAYRKEVFDELGGFDETFKTDYNDIDFCLRCIAAGYRVVYSPDATLYHFHNSSLKRTQDNDVERAAFLSRWSATVARDPYFNRHFQTQSQDLPLLPA